jgi:ketosteroid isomerase-like protein
MTSLAILPPSQISLDRLIELSPLIVEAERLGEDSGPGATPWYRIRSIVFDAYKLQDPQHPCAQAGEQIQPLSPDTLAQEDARRQLAAMWERGISASVCVAPSHVYRPALAPGARQCLMFLQPIVRDGNLAYMLAAFNSLERLEARAEVGRILAQSPRVFLDSDVKLALQPPAYRRVHSFFQCLESGDGAGAAASYAADVQYSDPLLGMLTGQRALLRWPHFLKKAQGLDLFFNILSTDAGAVKARYRLRYTDAGTGRRIDNDVHAEFTTRDDKIIRHRDSFSTWRFAAMQLGIQGRLLGFLPPLIHRLQREARADLEAFLSDTAAG